MQINVIAVGTRLEPWVYEAVAAYQARLPRHLNLSVSEIPAAKRRGGVSAAQAVAMEGERLLKPIREHDLVVALDERGQQWSSTELATALRTWQTKYARIGILIGGPDGLSGDCRKRADRLWSLSRLTFPHALVRVMLIEQIYRAWTILQGHPYHRA